MLNLQTRPPIPPDSASPLLPYNAHDHALYDRVVLP